MYEYFSGVNEQKKRERNSVIKFAVYNAVLASVIYFSYNSERFIELYYGIYALLFVLGIVFSKMHLFLKPPRRYGQVVAMNNFKVAHSLVTIYADTHKSGILSNNYFTVELLLDNRKIVSYEFEFKGEIQKLKIGDRIGIFRFLKMPVWED